MIRAFYKMYRKMRIRLHSSFQLRGVKRGKDDNVFGKIDIVSPQNLYIGNGCSFNHGVYINAVNQIRIGNDVTLSAGAKIISTGIDYVNWAKGSKQHKKDSGILIGNHVWIGANAMVLEGVEITGKYVVVAANAVVNKNIPDDYVIVGGCPAKILKRYSSHINQE